jgi:hypothetical protein
MPVRQPTQRDVARPALPLRAPMRNPARPGVFPQKLLLDQRQLIF